MGLIHLRGDIRIVPPTIVLFPNNFTTYSINQVASYQQGMKEICSIELAQTSAPAVSCQAFMRQSQHNRYSGTSELKVQKLFNGYM